MTDENVAAMKLDRAIVIQRHHLAIDNLDQNISQRDACQVLQRLDLNHLLIKIVGLPVDRDSDFVRLVPSGVKNGAVGEIRRVIQSDGFVIG